VLHPLYLGEVMWGVARSILSYSGARKR
jgi:hypothetical protein